MGDIKKIALNEFKESVYKLGACVSSITMEEETPDLIVACDDLPYVQLPGTNKFSINIETDSEGLERLQKALQEVPRDEQSQLKHDLETMHSVQLCEGKNINEKIDSYIDKKDRQAMAVKEELEKTGPKKKRKDTDKKYMSEVVFKYKIKHR